MSATPPGASTEYSRGIRSHDRDFQAREGAAARPAPGPRYGPTTALAGIVAVALLGALLLLVAELTTLFEVRTASAGAVRSVATGSHHGYGLVPVAILAALFGYAVWAAASRPALLAVGVLGLLALLIGLLGDLPDATANGLVLSGGHYVTAASSPSAGFYMETLGGVLLLIASVCGLLLIGAGRRMRPRPRQAGSSDGPEH